MKFKITLITVCIIAALLTMAACANTYTVTFDPNGGSILSGEALQTVNKGEDAVPPTPERRGYIFDGWEGDCSAVTGDVSIRAKWTPLYTVTFDVNGGNAADPALLIQSVKAGEDAVLPEVSREGYEFDGWSISDLTNVQNDLSVTAKWTKLWTVRYFLTGGEVADDDLLLQTVREGQIPTDPKPKRDQYTFIEWTESVDESKNAKYYTAVWERDKYTAAEISKLAGAATVEITTYRPSGDEWMLGSGFFINDSGLLVTNYHVVKGAYNIKAVVGNNTFYVSHVVDYDEAKDVAVVQVHTTGRATSYLELNNKLPAVGDTVYAVGSSLGLTGTFSSGIVSYVGRQIEGVSFLQTTAPISSGNSGGPLINEYGEVIGMNTATYAEGQNLNLAVTAKDILSVNEYGQIISLPGWFMDTSDYFLPGDMVTEVSEGNYTLICNNGFTYHSKLEREDRSFTVEAESSDQFVMFTLKVDDYNKLSQLRYDIISAELEEVDMYSNILYYDKYTPADMFKETVKLEDGSGMLMCVFQVPKARFDRGDTYYGILISGYTNIDYEYFSWVFYPEQLIDIEDFIK